MNDNSQQVIFEFTPLGRYTKVTAFDVATKIEVSITAASSCTKGYMQEIALKKLRYIMSKMP